MCRANSLLHTEIEREEKVEFHKEEEIYKERALNEKDKTSIGPHCISSLSYERMCIWCV